MTLKNFSSDLTMIAATVKRNIWLLVISVIGFDFVIPVATAITGQQMKDYILSVNQQTEYTVNSALNSAAASLMSTFQQTTAILVIIGAILAGTVLFAYLTNSKQTNLYHGIPLKRSKLFAINYFAGIAVFLIPFLLGVLINLGVIGMTGFADSVVWSEYLLIVLKSVLAFFCLYGIMILAVTLSGTVIMALLLATAFNGFIPAVLGLSQWIKSDFYNTYWLNYFPFYDWYIYTSPFINTYYSGTDAVYLLILAAVGIVSALAAVLCYKKRRSEAAGHSLAFNGSKLIVKIPLALIGAVAFAVIFYELGSSKLFWLYFGAVTGAVLICQFLNIWINGDFAAVKKGWVSVIAVAVISCAMLTYISNDMGNFDNYLPHAEDVESVQLDISGAIFYPRSHYLTSEKFDQSVDDSFYTGLDIVMDDPQTIAAVLTLAQNGIANAEQNRATTDMVSTYDVAISDDSADNDAYITLGVVYNLNNGQSKHRYYDTLNVNDVQEALKTVLDDKNFKENFALITQLQNNQIYIDEIQSFNNGTLHGTDIAESTQRALVAAYTEDYANLTAEQIADEMPIGKISLLLYTDNENLPPNQTEALSNKASSYDSAYAVCGCEYPIYPSFKNTLEIIGTNYGTDFFLYDINDINSISVINNTDNDTAQTNDEETVKQLYNNSLLKEYMTHEEYLQHSNSSEFIITDPAIMKKIMAQTYPVESLDYSPFRTFYIDEYYTVNYNNNYSYERYTLGN